MSFHLRQPLSDTLQPFTPLSLKSRIADAALDLSPYPHLVMPSVLPPFTVSDLHSYWPNGHDLATPSAGTGNAVSVSLSAFQQWAQGQQDPACVDTADYWRAFADGPVREILTALYGRYLPALRARFQDRLSELQLETNVTLEGGPLPTSQLVHAGHPSLLFEALVCLDPDGAGSIEWSLCEPLEAGDMHDGLAPLTVDAFRPVRTVPLHDNTLVSFLRTANSFHRLALRAQAVAGGHAMIRMQVRLSDDCVASLYGDDVGMLFREGISGHCPWLVPTLEAWRGRSWYCEPGATDTELRPLADSFDRMR